MSDNPYQSPVTTDHQRRMHVPTKDEILIIAGLLLLLASVTGPYIGYAMFGGYRGPKETYPEMQKLPPQEFQPAAGNETR